MVSAIVGRLPALKYFDAASSNSCQTSSAGCRQDTSACVCTSIAIKSFTFISIPRGSAPHPPILGYGMLAVRLRSAGVRRHFERLRKGQLREALQQGEQVQPILRADL